MKPSGTGICAGNIHQPNRKRKGASEANATAHQPSLRKTRTIGNRQT